VTLPRPGRQGRIAKDRAWANRTTRRVMTPSNRLPRTCAQTPWVIDVAKTPLPSRQHAHRLHTHCHVRPSCMTVPGDRDALSWLYQWLPRPAFSPWGSLNINVSRPLSVTVCTTCVHIDMRSAENITTPSLHCIRTHQPPLHGHCTSSADTRHLLALDGHNGPTATALSENAVFCTQREGTCWRLGQPIHVYPLSVHAAISARA
jgi:hypothetical protein